MPRIYDNIENHLVNGLRDALEPAHRADFCVGYFNLRGWKHIIDDIDKLKGEIILEGNQKVHRTCRLLVGMQRPPLDILREFFFKDEEHVPDLSEMNRIATKLAEEFRQQLTIGVPTNEDEAALRRLSYQLKENKVVVKLYLREQLHAKLYLTHSKNKQTPIVGFLGSINLTFSGMKGQGELNVDVLDEDACNKLSKWFNNRWNDRKCIDISQQLIEVIDNSWATETPVKPYHIYLKMAYHLSSEARAGINEFKLSKKFQTELLEFQQKAVQVAAHHLHKRNGVLIGDVVGLGKTITATALAKIFEDDFFLETLIICPRNLVEMWNGYIYEYKLHALAISQSQVQTILPTLRRYRLVIIDESHNLRNDEGARYRAIKSYIEQNESKVILLSATPYNKSFKDLSNQLRLFIDDDKDMGIIPERFVESIGGQVQFSARYTETFIKSIKAFEKSEFADDWRELMRLYMVRRTRSFIKENYTHTDPANNRKYLTFSDGTKSYFPDRIPKRVLYTFKPGDKNDIYAHMYDQKVVDIINALNLPRYGLQTYLLEKPTIRATDKEQAIMQSLSYAGRRLMGFCRTNLFKRLESSGFAFLLSLSRHILRNYVFVYALQNGLEIPIGKNISQNLDDFIEDNDPDGNDENELQLILNEKTYLKKAKELYTLYAGNDNSKKYDWIRSGFFDNKLITHLINDSLQIMSILEKGKGWKAEDDKQMNALYALLDKTHKHEKVIVFTQFADTARYLAENLIKKGITQISVVTGDDENPTEFAHRFSPISNKKDNIAGTTQELRVLISTDVLSEGQNLQDAHIIVNYDLPWAIIRLIQRAGRVDRIGQKAETILCYSFFPEEGIENIIRLRRTLARRIEENATVVGSDETFFDEDKINLENLYNEKSGILDTDEEDNEVDLASQAYQIWKNATDADSTLLKKIPNMPDVANATRHNTYEPEKQGVILYARTAEDNDELTWLDAKGDIITQSQYTILKAAECTLDTVPKPRMEKHYDLVKKGIDNILNEEKHSGGTLGKKSGVKYRVYMRLDRYCKENEGTLFVIEDLKRAVDEIYKYTLKEYGRETLARQMKMGVDDQQLAALVVSLREENKLAIIDEKDEHIKEPKIICSLGLSNN